MPKADRCIRVNCHTRNRFAGETRPGARATIGEGACILVVETVIPPSNTVAPA